jgi:lipopolysaccharide transport system ATP-binding protein
MSTVIKIENVSKQYRLGLIGTNTLKGDLQRWWYNIRGLPDPTLMIGQENVLSTASRTPYAAHPDDFIWALKGINYEVKQGEVLGIIGKNGAGKSTLLKLLSRVTAPTTGSIKVKGRIASLLEVGTGFHPELTGRENIFLNGAILGMTKTEIRSKFDEIVDFAGVNKYIDTPVKRYSSGMYVRLAFAVAAHLEPEILIVDEVLAVGDAEFQKKAIGKMQDVSKNEGRTVLFVSHNLSAVNQLCTECILLSNGKIDKSGNTNYIINQYLSIHNNNNEVINLTNANCNRSGNNKVQFQKIWLKRENSSGYNRLFSIGENIVIGFTLIFKNPNEKMVKTAIELKTQQGLRLANMIDIDSNFQVEFSNKDIVTYNVVLENVIFYPGTYFLSFYAGDMSSTEKYDYVEDSISFEIIDGGKLTTRNLPQSAGLLFFTPRWTTCK